MTLVPSTIVTIPPYSIVLLSISRLLFKVIFLFGKMKLHPMAMRVSLFLWQQSDVLYCNTLCILIYPCYYDLVQSLIRINWVLMGSTLRSLSNLRKMFELPKSAHETVVRVGIFEIRSVASPVSSTRTTSTKCSNVVKPTMCIHVNKKILYKQIFLMNLLPNYDLSMTSTKLLKCVATGYMCTRQ